MLQKFFQIVINYIFKTYLDTLREKNYIKTVPIKMITDIEKNKQMSEIKVEPEELCGLTVTQIVETQSTCSTTGLFSIKSKTLFFVKY